MFGNAVLLANQDHSEIIITQSLQRAEYFHLGALSPPIASTAIFIIDILD